MFHISHQFQYVPELCKLLKPHFRIFPPPSKTCTSQLPLSSVIGFKCCVTLFPINLICRPLGDTYYHSLAFLPLFLLSYFKHKDQQKYLSIYLNQLLHCTYMWNTTVMFAYMYTLCKGQLRVNIAISSLISL
jgi:hypothetical protein